MFTDKELDILEIEIFPVVTKYNDLQKVFENLDEDYIDLFSKWCQYEGLDISEIAIGTFGKKENDTLYLCGYPKIEYKKYNGGWVIKPGSKKIKKVITESKIILPENCEGVFYEYEILESIEGSDKGDTSNVNNMFSMFFGCEKLENLDVSTGDVSNVWSTRWMFAGCTKLEFLDTSNGNTNKISDMGHMFEQCENLKEIKGILNWDIRNVQSSYDAFHSINDNIKDKDKILQKFGE